MPKIVVMDKKVVKGITVCNFLAGGRDTDEIQLWTDDVVKDFSYLDGRIIRRVTGRLSNVNLSFNTNKPKNKFNIRDLASVSSVDIDLSSCYHSNVVTIPSESVLEYRVASDEEEAEETACICPYAEVSEKKCICKAKKEAEEKKCTCETCPKASTCTCEYCVEGEETATAPTPAIDDTAIFPVMRLKLHVKLSDRTCKDVDIIEGDKFTGVIYKTTPAPKVVYGHFTVLGFMYKGAGNNVDIVGLILDDGETTSQVLLSDIKSFGSEDVKLSGDDLKGDSLDSKICKYCCNEKVSAIDLTEASRTTKEIKFKKELAVRGLNALTPVNEGALATDTIDERKENVFEGKIDIAQEDGASVSLIGLTLTKKAAITYKNPTKLELINTKVVGIEGTNESGNNKPYLIAPASGQTFDTTKPTTVTVSGCYFGKNGKDEE